MAFQLRPGFYVVIRIHKNIVEYLKIFTRAPSGSIISIKQILIRLCINPIPGIMFTKND